MIEFFFVTNDVSASNPGGLFALEIRVVGSSNDAAYNNAIMNLTPLSCTCSIRVHTSGFFMLMAYEYFVSSLL